MANIPKREFGKTGLKVTALGFGGGQVGDGKLPEKDAEILLNQVLDIGITLIDTARGYGLSEERIGKYLKHRRKEFVLSTKVGYGIPNYTDWTYDCIIAGVDAALARLQTDVIDIIHLHTCTLDVLKKGDVIQALEEVQKKGKAKVISYSGENDWLDYAIETHRFQSIQMSVNLCDQRIIDGGLVKATRDRLGVIAKRPIANAPWRFNERPVGNYAEEYWHRWKTMNLDPHDLPWQELAMRFSAYQPGVHTCIVGTAKLDHLKENLGYVLKGQLPENIVKEIRDSFKKHDQNWVGQV